MIHFYIFLTRFKWVLISLYIVVFIAVLGGNFLVCFAVLYNKHMHTISNIFLMNFSACDFHNKAEYLSNLLVRTMLL